METDNNEYHKDKQMLCDKHVFCDVSIDGGCVYNMCCGCL